MRKRILILASLCGLVLVVLSIAADIINDSLPISETLFLPVVANQPPAYVPAWKEASQFTGEVRVVGEVLSLTSVPLYHVQVEVQGYDPFGQLLIFPGTTIFTATLPGQLNPFDIYTSVDSLSFIKVKVVNWSYEEQINYVEATVTNMVVNQSGNGAWVVTTIRNDYSKPIMNVQGIAWSFYTWDIFQLQPVTDTLLPGATAIFTTSLAGSVTQFNTKAAAQGVIAP